MAAEPGREPDEQRKALSGFVVTDELALDNAVLSLDYAKDEAGFPLPDEVVAATSLNDMLAAPPDADFWDNAALDSDPAWAQARTMARRLLRLIPQLG